MEQFNLLSSPLSTLFPNYSIQKQPDYDNAFQMDLSGLQRNTFPMTDFSQDFSQQVQPYMTSMQTINSFVNPSESTYVIPRREQSKYQNQKLYGNINSGLDNINNLFTGIFGEKSEYSGDSGVVSQGLDSAYDSIENYVSGLGPAGQIASIAMKSNKLLGNIANKLGAGTDGMTTTDAILGSSFLQLTPFGLINGIFGKNTNTITKDNEAFEKVGAAYGGTNAIVDDALTKSDKKYGLFSSKARKQANKEIAEANTQQSIMSDIADEATDRFTLADSMAAINSNKRALKLQGAYNPSTLRFGKNGMSLQILERVKSITSEMKKLQLGGIIVDPFEIYIQSLPESQRDSTNYRVRDYWEYNGRPKNFEEAKQKGMFKWEEDFDDKGNSIGHSWHAFTVAKNPNADEYDFMKSSSHPTLQKELDWYYSDDPEAISFRKEYELQKTQPYYKYVKRTASHTDTPQHKNGGSIIEQVLIPTEILLVDPRDIPEFQEGGSINVIPEGALHARKHNMDMDGITKKGIPVVSNNDNGKVEQQAEIEREEIIFRLEVTKKLEELQKKYYDSNTSQEEKDALSLEAGKLLVKEILYNTADNVNLINRV